MLSAKTVSLKCVEREKKQIRNKKNIGLLKEDRLLKVFINGCLYVS
jgi:hypothetical protein